jgi:hypothetical protein
MHPKVYDHNLGSIKPVESLLENLVKETWKLESRLTVNRRKKWNQLHIDDVVRSREAGTNQVFSSYPPLDVLFEQLDLLQFHYNTL